MFYIYEWYNTDTNEVFYVGKGVYNRYKVKRRNKDSRQANYSKCRKMLHYFSR